MTFSSAVTTVTRTHIVPRVFDNSTKGSPTLMTLLRNAKPWQSGTKYEFPIKVLDSTNGGNTGVADQLDRDRQNVRTTASFEVKAAYKPIVLADIEQKLNQGDERIVSLLEAEYDSQAQSLGNLMAENLFTGSGVGNSWDSLANAADDGTAYVSYGGVSGSTYPVWNGYYLANAGALTLNKLATAYDAVEIGLDSPTIISTTKAIWSTYESLLSPTVRYNYTGSGYPKMDAYGMLPTTEALKGQAGFSVLFFRGTPIVKDEQVPSGKLFLINQNYFGFKGVDMSGVDGMETLNFKKRNEGVPLGVPGRVPSTRGFNFRPMMHPVDQFASVGYVSFWGNFIATQRRLQGQLSGLS